MHYIKSIERERLYLTGSIYLYKNTAYISTKLFLDLTALFPALDTRDSVRVSYSVNELNGVYSIPPQVCFHLFGGYLITMI